jgi:type II secretory ATPase GspE/PulE/Tfp pilus assembly ATPase PilB-like protein
MADTTTITGRVLETLIESGLITSEQATIAEEAAASQGVSVGQTLVARGLISEGDVATVLEDEMGIPAVELTSYAPDDSALALVPLSVARARRILPLFEIEGMLTVAIGDPLDVFTLDAVAAELGVEVEPVLADAASVLEAIVHYYGEQEAAAEEAPAQAAAPEPVEATLDAGFVGADVPLPPVAVDDLMFADDLVDAPLDEPVPAELVEAVAEAEAAAASDEVSDAEIDALVAEPTPAKRGAGAPKADIDLDILAVAEPKKVALLVNDIVDDAVARGASRIHLLPYKDDFYLVYRMGGRLEKVADAPLSMQKALVEGFKNYARLGTTPTDVPALGRVHRRIQDQDLILTVSVVPTVAGSRLVVSIAPHRTNPHALADLGMTDAEAKALQAMVERGRGILLICAPIAGGASATYYSLLAHAASAGKTSYSVERTVEYELPAVAQVMVNAGSAVGAAAYLQAGMRQDTDIIAIDGVRTADEVHMAIEAAGQGKLIIATFAAGDIAHGLRRLIDLGVDPASLAPALTMGVGQRLVRTNCPSCAGDVRSPLAGAAGLAADAVTAAGAGCDACGRTGFAGVTGVFEVLLFNDRVRGAVASGRPADAIAAAADAAGMRPLLASGVGKVEAGLTSLEELDRVLHFTE